METAKQQKNKQTDYHGWVDGAHRKKNVLHKTHWNSARSIERAIAEMSNTWNSVKWLIQDMNGGSLSVLILRRRNGGREGGWKKCGCLHTLKGNLIDWHHLMTKSGTWYSCCVGEIIKRAAYNKVKSYEKAMNKLNGAYFLEKSCWNIQGEIMWYLAPTFANFIIGRQFRAGRK